MLHLKDVPGHEFWADDISLLDGRYIDVTRLFDSAQITDSYLLALAFAHKGKLATFDRTLVTTAVTGAKHALQLID